MKRPVSPEVIEAQREIKAAIRFYERRGRSWLWAVCFIAFKACFGHTNFVLRTRIGA